MFGLVEKTILITTLLPDQKPLKIFSPGLWATIKGKAMYTATHYLRVTMIVPKSGLDVMVAETFALASVRARRLGDGEFIASWGLAEMAHETPCGRAYRVPLFA